MVNPHHRSIHMVLFHPRLLPGAEYHRQPIETILLKPLFAFRLDQINSQTKNRTRASRGNFFGQRWNVALQPIINLIGV